VYCTRTIVEMEKTVDELKGVMECRKKEFGEEGKLLALCLSSRRNLCIHEAVSKLDSREAVDAGCRERTSSWLRQEEEVPIEELDRQGKRCRFFENTSKTTQMEGVFTLEDLKDKGRREGVCPYFLAREFLLKAQVVVFNYSYMLDPKVANLVSSSLPPSASSFSTSATTSTTPASSPCPSTSTASCWTKLEPNSTSWIKSSS